MGLDMSEDTSTATAAGSVQDSAELGLPQFSRDVQAPSNPLELSNKDLLGKLETPGTFETVLAAIALIAWASFFAAGVLVATSSYRNVLWSSTPIEFTARLRALIVTFCCYTVTNLFFLSCLSAHLGCMASRWQIPQMGSKATEILSRVPFSRIYISAWLRGFLLYLLIISGVLIVSSEGSMQDTTPIQYVKIAGFVSILAFVVGFDAQIAYNILEKMGRLISTVGDTNRPKS
jgi:hypothetical protein